MNKNLATCVERICSQAYNRIDGDLRGVRESLIGVPVVLMIGKYRGYVGFVKSVEFELRVEKKCRDGGMIWPMIFLEIPMKSDPTRHYWDRADARSWWELDQVRFLTEDEVHSLPNGRYRAAKYFADKRNVEK